MQIDPLFSTLFNQHQPEEKQCLPQGNCLRYIEINLFCSEFINEGEMVEVLPAPFQSFFVGFNLTYCVLSSFQIKIFCPLHRESTFLFIHCQCVSFSILKLSEFFISYAVFCFWIYSIVLYIASTDSTD